MPSSLIEQFAGQVAEKDGNGSRNQHTEEKPSYSGYAPVGNSNYGYLPCHGTQHLSLIHILDKAISQWKRLREDLEFVLKVEDEGYVYWVESSLNDSTTSSIQAAPIEMAAALRETLFGSNIVAVLTSATLASPSLDFTSQRLGIDNYFSRVLQSPFDHQENAACLLYTSRCV